MIIVRVATMDGTLYPRDASTEVVISRLPLLNNFHVVKSAQVLLCLCISLFVGHSKNDVNPMH